MALIAHQVSLFIFFTLLLSLHARDSHFFNKIPSTTPQPLVVPQNDNNSPHDPAFVPDDTGNTYGLYGHESAQLPPSKYLPKNYNPVAYVTVPEDTHDDSINKNNYYGGEQEMTGLKNYPTTTSQVDADSNNNNNNYYSAGGSSFNSQPLTDTPQFDSFQAQGMSDTRSLENGRYFYGVGNDVKYGVGPFGNRLDRNEFVDDNVNNNYNFP